jgi:regulator of nucleoside diphosphate kinase
MITKAQAISKSRIYITEYDMECLRAFVTRMLVRDMNGRELRRLQEILDLADVVTSSPINIVTLDSVVRLRDLDSCRELVYRLVWPLHADMNHHKVSVLAPLGMAMLGRRVGDEFEVEAPAGVRSFLVEELLYQPERWEFSEGQSSLYGRRASRSKRA